MTDDLTMFSDANFAQKANLMIWTTNLSQDKLALPLRVEEKQHAKFVEKNFEIANNIKVNHNPKSCKTCNNGNWIVLFQEAQCCICDSGSIKGEHDKFKIPFKVHEAAYAIFVLLANSRFSTFTTKLVILVFDASRVS